MRHRSIITAIEQARRRGIDIPHHLSRADQERLLEQLDRPRARGNRMGAFPSERFAWSPPGRTLHLVLPGYLPPSLNEYSRQQSVRRRAVPEAVEQIRLALLVAKADGRSFWTPELQIGLWFPTRRRRDARTNWTKVIEDALVEAGLMVDDSDQWCRTLDPVIATDPVNPRTEITLTEH